MFISKKQRTINDLSERNRILMEEKKKLEDIILDAKKEIAWAKMITSSNNYGRQSEIIASTLRKLEEIEDILGD